MRVPTRGIMIYVAMAALALGVGRLSMLWACILTACAVVPACVVLPRPVVRSICVWGLVGAQAAYLGVSCRAKFGPSFPHASKAIRHQQAYRALPTVLPIGFFLGGTVGLVVAGAPAGPGPPKAPPPGPTDPVGPTA